MIKIAENNDFCGGLLIRRPQVRALVGEPNNHRVTITLSKLCSAIYKAVPQTRC